MGTKEININTKFITLDRLVMALGTDAAKSSSLLESQIRGWLEAHGWEYKRAGKPNSEGARPRGYVQPDEWPPKIQDDEEGLPPPAAPPKPTGSPAQGTDPEDDDHVPF